MTIWLTTDNVQYFNERFVGPDKLRDFGLLEAAVMRPQATAFGDDAYPSLHEKAAALLHSLARNHPFVDGNKRTGWAAVTVFYRINGYTVADEIDPGQVVGLVVDVAEGQIDVPAIAATLKQWAQPFPSPEEWLDDPDDGGGRHHAR
ncbi:MULTISPECIES: type II toxin-antitoxin system death-on-curing family toxin [unclassified Mycobacterium]|uniref:type II toxin-antitoxin system death-on-curing family toxin n=1 Tax=unclassified Mycobacterium TaxID=2642494 RepID=UPI0008013513|nr:MULTISPECIES: type II toxin-antitoxin system death-on-curing family toxin [unclassified Mycobacterium]OBG75340.1 death-on-curing protein [Mycobacterium sp. E1214]OBH31598.1 death-on-curing protein [Mycobacterium sp. E1319]